MEQPLVSVITPCYNGEKYVKYLFDSLLAQTYKNLEIIFVNDGSTDKTEEVVYSYQEQFKKQNMNFVYLKQENKGQAAALNQGLKIFKGEYFIWPDADDYLDETSIEKRVNFLIEHPEYGFVRSNAMCVDFITKQPLHRILDNDYIYHDEIFLDLVNELSICCCGCYMVRKQVFLSIYPHRQIYESRGGQNWQLLLPIASRCKCGYIDENLYYCNVRENSHSRGEKNYETQLQRLNDLKKIMINAFTFSEGDFDQLLLIADKRYTRAKFLLAYEYNRIEDLKIQFRHLKEHSYVTDEDERKFYEKVRTKLASKGLVFRQFSRRVFRRIKRLKLRG